MNVQLAVNSVGGTLCWLLKLRIPLLFTLKHFTRDLRPKILCNRYKNNELKSSLYHAASRLGKCSPLATTSELDSGIRFWSSTLQLPVMNSRRKLPWKWWTQYHIKSRKTTNDNIQLEWLQVVRTKKKFRVVLKPPDIFCLRLSPSRLWSAVCCIITGTMLSCTSLSSRKINCRFPLYWKGSFIISGAHHTYSFIPWGSDIFYHGVDLDHTAENNHQ